MSIEEVSKVNVLIHKSGTATSVMYYVLLIKND